VTLSESSVTSVPLTLRAVLGARIDALPTAARDALGVASVIGMRFDQARIEALMGGPLPPGTLERVADAGLVVPDERGWRFSHPLIHDTAYAGVLAVRRRQLHASFADQLEARQGTRAMSLIAVHRAASGDAVRAIPLLEAAAGAALALGAATEAASFWRTAAELTTDATEAAAYRSRAAEALAAVGGT
jgi:predicted ATPase